MNSKLIIYLIVILFVIILIGLFFSRKNPEIIPLPPVVEIESEQITDNTRPSLERVLSSQRVITVIPTVRPKQNPQASEVIKEKRREQATSYDEPTENTALRQVSNTGSFETSAGVTVINKERPTQEKVNELNSRGIIIY